MNAAGVIGVGHGDTLVGCGALVMSVMDKGRD